MVQVKDLSDREMLETIIARWEAIRDNPGGDTPFPADMLADRFPEKVVMRKMEQLDDAGALNCGVSLRTSWIETDYLDKHFPDLVERHLASIRRTK